ncbi:MAG: hypothetical protein ACLP1E_10690 [Acidimicrobiales bacterium]
MINADKLGKRAATRSDAEFAAEEARLLDELLASADLSSPTVPEIRSGDQTSDTEASHDQVTWHAPAPAPEQPEEQAETVSPSAYSAPESASPTPTDATTMISGDELRELEELHQAWTLVDTEPVAEEAKPVDEPPASPELGLPTVPALLPGDQTIDAVTSQDRGFWQASVPAPEQPVEQAVSPSAYGAPESAVPTVTDTATTINDDELRELEEPHRTWTLGDAELDAEEAKPVDEPPAPAELSSPAALEALPGDQTTDAETPQDLGTWQVPVPAPEQPVEQAVTESPSADSTPESAVPTVTDTATTINDDELRELEELHRTWTLGDAELDAEEAKPVDEPPAPAELSSPAALEALPGDQTTDAVTPQDLGTIQAPVPAPEQPEPEAATPSPSAYGTPESAIPTVTDTATTINDDELRELEELHRTWTLGDAELDAEEAKPVDEPPAPAELSSAAALEAPPGDQTTDAETPQDLGTIQAPAPRPEQPEPEAATPSPSAYGTPESAIPTHTTSATISADKPAKPDIPHRVWNFRDIAAVAEEVKPVHEPPSSAELSSAAALEALPGDQTTDAETPQDLGTSQAPVPAPEQPVEQAATVSPSPHIAPAPDVPKPTTSGTINADEPDKLAARYRSWSFRDIAAAAEQAKPVDKPSSSAELGSPSVPEVLPGDQTADAETPQDLGTRQAPVPVPEQPVEQAVTASPSAHIAPSLAVPTHTASATVNVDRPGKLDARYRPWTLSAAELVAEEDSTYATTVDAARPGSLDARYRPWTLSAAELVAEEEKPVDEPAPSIDLSSDTTPEVRSADQTSDAEAVRGQATRQADLLPAPPQAEEPGVTVSPPTSSAPKSAGTASGDTTAMVTADKPAELGARYRPWTLRDTKPGAEQAKPIAEQAKPVDEPAKPVDGPAASADLTSDTTPEVRSDEQASDAETPHDQVTSPAEPAPAPEEPEEQMVTVPPSSYSAPTSVPTFTNVTTILGETKKSSRPLRVSPTAVGILALVFLLAALGTGFVALRQNSSAGQWRQHDQNAVALNHALSTRNDVLSRDLASARAAVTSLNSQTSVLSGQVKSLQIKLSSTASANGRALARTALLTQLTKEAGTVSSELSMCVGEVSSLQTEIANDLSNLSHKDPLLQSNTRTASQVCASAQLGNQQLQTTLHGAG